MSLIPATTRRRVYAQGRKTTAKVLYVFTSRHDVALSSVADFCYKPPTASCTISASSVMMQRWSVRCGLKKKGALIPFTATTFACLVLFLMIFKCFYLYCKYFHVKLVFKTNFTIVQQRRRFRCFSYFSFSSLSRVLKK